MKWNENKYYNENKLDNENKQAIENKESNKNKQILTYGRICATKKQTLGSHFNLYE